MIDIESLSRSTLALQVSSGLRKFSGIEEKVGFCYQAQAGDHSLGHGSARTEVCPKARSMTSYPDTLRQALLSGQTGDCGLRWQIQIPPPPPPPPRFSQDGIAVDVEMSISVARAYRSLSTHMRNDIIFNHTLPHNWHSLRWVQDHLILLLCLPFNIQRSTLILFILSPACLVVRSWV